jgi:hypothetical protein
MKVIIFGIACFFMMFIFHLGLWKIKVPQKPFKVLFFLVLFFSLLGIFVWKLVPLSFLPETGIAFIHAELLFLCLGFSYIFFYQGIKTKSPSISIIMIVGKAGKEGVERAVFNNMINNDQLIKPRIKFLAQAGLATVHEGKYQLTGKGEVYANLFSWYRQFLRLSGYGG